MFNLITNIKKRGGGVTHDHTSKLINSWSILEFFFVKCLLLQTLKKLNSGAIAKLSKNHLINKKIEFQIYIPIQKCPENSEYLFIFFFFARYM